MQYVKFTCLGGGGGGEFLHGIKSMSKFLKYICAYLHYRTIKLDQNMLDSFRGL